ncbi:anti-sigma factor family protein [Parahaliea aestuarii]|uniref:Anti-sigma factor n=1 Tax=Parahaliea aestuarii TaxID=1852021 RepID=A0A5C8ZTD8_9GAMM|nr:hypothetical protein [Parahaliea aestuarii]TXS91716.1 hypothetical protein FVW59_11205 [Parahaliea aestuarii]
MTTQDLELLSQYLDGELAAGEVAHLEQRLAKEAPLAAELRRLRQADDAVKAFVEQGAAGPVPSHIAELLAPVSQSARVIPFPSRRGRAAVGFAIAASLVAAVGLVLAPQWQQAGNGPQLLAEALETTPSSAEQWSPLADGRALRPVLSFAGDDGRWCREYQLSDAGKQWRGVACRGENGWQTEVQVGEPADLDNGSEYLPAGAGDVDAISSFINRNATGIPLSAAEEASLIDQGWR